MIFLSPEFLYYMLPMLFALFMYVFIRKESHEHYFSKDILDKLKVNDTSLTLRQRDFLLFIVGALCIVALAQPVLEDGKVKVTSTSADILIALDISDSMLAQDVYPNRFEFAKLKALEFIKKASNDRIGVVAFAKNSYLVSPISFDTKTVSFLVSKLDTSSISQKGTDIFTMLETVSSIHTNTDEKYVLLLSDGGNAKDFSTEIEYANKKNIVVFILAIGEETATPIKKEDGSFIMDNDVVVLSKLNSAISELAIQTGGVYIQNTTSSRDITTMLDKILENSQHKELKSQEVERYVSLFYYPIILAMIILLAAFSSVGKSVKHTVPIFIGCMFFASTSPLIADFFDFATLMKAKKHYEVEDYNTSAYIYKRYAQRSDNGEAHYNAGNAYYKDKKYLEALSSYSYARLEDKNQEANKLSNMGNTLVRLGTINTLQRAVKHYEASLKIKEDRSTRENLEAVKKALQENEKKIKKEKEEEKIYAQQKGHNTGDQDEADDTNTKNKNKNNKGGNTSKNKKSDEKIAPGVKAKSEESQSQGDKNDDENSNGDGEAQNAKQDTKDLKDKNKLEVKKKNYDSRSTLQDNEMSDLEQAKWFKKLSINQSTYLYRLNEQRSENEEKNEKPW